MLASCESLITFAPVLWNASFLFLVLIVSELTMDASPHGNSTQIDGNVVGQRAYHCPYFQQNKFRFVVLSLGKSKLGLRIFKVMNQFVPEQQF